LGSFFAPETDMIFGDGVGASLVFHGHLDSSALPRSVGCWSITLRISSVYDLRHRGSFFCSMLCITSGIRSFELLWVACMIMLSDTQVLHTTMEARAMNAF